MVFKGGELIAQEKYWKREVNNKNEKFKNIYR